jgi:hypothetical protein
MPARRTRRRMYLTAAPPCTSTDGEYESNEWPRHQRPHAEDDRDTRADKYSVIIRQLAAVVAC